MGRPLWFVQFLQKFFPYRFQLAELVKLPGVRTIINEHFFDQDEMIYLPKDQVIKHERLLIQQPLERPESLVLPSTVVHHFIDQANDWFILNRCLCREAEHCKNYPIDLGCLFLGSPVRGINPKFGRWVTREEAHAHEEKARQAGLVHLIGRYKIDAIWLGTGPANHLLTICNCCPCCCFATTIPVLEPKVDIRVRRVVGVEVRVDEEACIGCGRCARDVCFVDAINLTGGKAHISEACRACGRCVEICPREAIHLKVVDSTWIDQTIQRINGLVRLD